MVNIRARVRANRRFIAQAESDIKARAAEIKRLQSICEHNWKFVRQVNSFHVLHWTAVYECSKCGIGRVDENRLPVCSVHNSLSLIRAKRGDKEVEAERRKPKYKGYQGRHNPLRAYRCSMSTCGKIHMLSVSVTY